MSKIKEFQQQNGLTADGVIGKKTLEKMKEVFGISDNIKLAHFLGQIHHETGGFTLHTENLNYSESGLLTTFKKYFDNETAKKYARNAEMIANRVYANRMGNGDELSGDGWRYRGRGSIQLTGKSNYSDFNKWLVKQGYCTFLDLLEQPELVATTFYWHSALFFFERNNIWSLCTDVSDSTITKVTKKINGGTNGLQDRINKTKYYYSLAV